MVTEKETIDKAITKVLSFAERMRRAKEAMEEEASEVESEGTD